MSSHRSEPIDPSSSPSVTGLSTRAVRGSRRGPVEGGPLLPTIVQGATFAQASIGEASPHTYSRASTPTVAALEDALAAVSGAGHAVAFASGVAATTAIALATLAAGDHAVVGRTSYGGTIRLFRDLLAPLGIRTTFVDARDLRAVAAGLEARTRLVLVESPTNPTLELVDLLGLSQLTKAARVPLVVDNTFLTAASQRVLELGADVELLSTTKWIDGHHATIGGALVTDDEALAERLRWFRKSLGSIQSPFAAWLTLQGLKTLPVRLARHAATASEIARRLDGHPAVVRTSYPGLRTHPQWELARRQHRPANGGGHGGVVGFELADAAAAAAFVRALRLVTLAESLGGAESLITHPATMTHADLPPATREALGITPGFLRLSVGLEDCEDIWSDLAAALDAVRPAREAIGAEEVLRAN